MNFSLFTCRTPLWDMKLTSKSTKCSSQAFQKVAQRSPGALRSGPGEPQEAPESSPRELSGDLWVSKRSPGVVLGASEPHFGAPRACFTYLSSFSKPSRLSSLLFSFSFSRICYYFHPLFFSLFSSLTLFAAVHDVIGASRHRF